MCLTEMYSTVRVGKNLSEMFPIRNGLKQGDALSPFVVTALVQENIQLQAGKIVCNADLTRCRFYL